VSEGPFAHFRELWQETLQPALAEWHAMSAKDKAVWEESCPPQYRSGQTFFLLNRLYGASKNDPLPST